MLRARHGTHEAELHSQEVLNNQTLKADDTVVASRDREGRHREERKGQVNLRDIVFVANAMSQVCDSKRDIVTLDMLQ